MPFLRFSCNVYAKQCNTKICCNHYLSIQREKLLLFILYHIMLWWCCFPIFGFGRILYSFWYMLLLHVGGRLGAFQMLFFFWLPLSNMISILLFNKLKLLKWLLYCVFYKFKCLSNFPPKLHHISKIISQKFRPVWAHCWKKW